MMSFCLVGALIAIVAGVSAAPRPVSTGWPVHRRADPDELIPLKFSLAQSNIDKLESFLLYIADSLSPRYRKHWFSAKVAETFQPSKETTDSVHSWLVYDGDIHADKVKLSPNGDIIQLDVTIAEAENLLQTEYYVTAMTRMAVCAMAVTTGIAFLSMSRSTSTLCGRLYILADHAGLLSVGTKKFLQHRILEEYLGRQRYSLAIA
jgi:hypothetical protein